MTLAGRTPALTGAQKCAVLCIALGPKGAGRVLQQLGEEEVERITREISSMRRVGPDVVDRVLEEFQGAAQAEGGAATGGPDVARQLLEQALGAPRAQMLMDRVRLQAPESALSRLHRAAPETILQALRGEHPQTAALVLAHLQPARSARVLEAMPPELASDTLMRVARMERVAPETLRMVEAALGEKAELSLSTTNEATGGPEAVARLLNTISPEHEHALFEGMRQIDQELAERVRALRLVFEDLVGLDAKGIQRVLREVDGRDLSLSLKAASDDVKVRIRSGLTERAAAALEEEIEMLGPVRVRDVEEAQQRILDTVRALEEAGEIVLRRSGGRDDVIG